MADEELPGTEPAGTNDGEDRVVPTPAKQTADNDDARDIESSVDSSEKSTAGSFDDDSTASSESEGTDGEGQDEDDDLNLPMDKINALLNAEVSDKDALTPQMRRVVQRQSENTKRAEESIKGTRANPGWFVPLFCTLMVIGLVWAVVYYLTSAYPIPTIGAGNLAIAFAIIMVGFLMTMWWH
ncbi:cell division protein CrgA [uncultured Bifidobacterium sp.]|uniref:cell division protein CrgA n=1 Tax=uncultured Bifidobacterium sp. TaxID=165187 RepID=UPI0026165D4E|nr:cell division protein CrgA [uncultured Bifidobacterium sp.]